MSKNTNKIEVINVSLAKDVEYSSVLHHNSAVNLSGKAASTEIAHWDNESPIAKLLKVIFGDEANLSSLSDTIPDINGEETKHHNLYTARKCRAKYAKKKMAGISKQDLRDLVDAPELANLSFDLGSVTRSLNRC